MKKLTVLDSTLDKQTTDEISLFTTSRYAYGLSDFSLEKVSQEISKVFSLEIKELSFPLVTLTNTRGEAIIMKCVEE